MTPENIARRNELMQRIHSGDILGTEDRIWLQKHPFFSVRYGAPYITADIIAVEPGKEIVLTVQCIQDDPQHPIVPTLTIPFEKNGFLKLAAVATSNADFRKMRKSTKLSLRMIRGITATLRCQSESGLVMVSYQGWVPDNKPMPLWFESIQCPRFAMKKTVLSENMVQYECCGANSSVEDLDADEMFSRFGFIINWYTV